MIFGLWGEDKSCKTTLALTFPKPLVFMEFDIGGFDRAIYRFQQEFNQGQIKYEAYPMPMTFGKFDPSKLEVRPSKTIVGMKELFYQWAAKYITHLQNPDISSIVIDTATILHSINADCYLQEMQETQMETMDPATGLDKNKKTLRTQLQQIEYKEPNTRMRGILYQAKSHGKNLIMTHHARDEYKPMLQKDGSLANSSTGKRERAGFATLGDSADVIVRTYWDDKAAKKDSQGNVIQRGMPFCEVDLAEVKALERMKFEEPSFGKIDKTIRMMKGIP